MATKMAVTNLRVSLEATDEGIDELAASIKKHGFIRPIVIDSTGLVLDGVRRLKAAQQLGLKTVSVDSSNDYEATMDLISQNHDGPCHIPPDHWRIYRLYADTLGQRQARTAVARSGNANANLHGGRKNGRGHQHITPSRDLLAKAVGRTGHDVQASIMLVGVAKNLTHPLNKEAVKLTEMMDKGMTGSAAEQRWHMILKAKAGNTISDNEQREIISNAITNMTAIAATLNRIRTFDPNFTVKELSEWHKQFGPVRGALMSLGHRFKVTIEERSEETK